MNPQMLRFMPKTLNKIKAQARRKLAAPDIVPSVSRALLEQGTLGNGEELEFFHELLWCNQVPSLRTQ